MKKLLLATVAISMVLSCTAYAEKDDHDARVKQAEELLKVSPPQDLVDQVVGSLAKNPRAQLTADDIKNIEASFDYAALGKAMEDGLVKTFTLDELKLMTQLYGSETGRSIIHKMPEYMGSIGPVLQQQLREHVGDYMRKKQAGASAPAMSTPAPSSTPAPAAPATSAPAPETPAKH